MDESTRNRLTYLSLAMESNIIRAAKHDRMLCENLKLVRDELDNILGIK